jgi:RNA polymerase sigma factor (sigma-70 family)
MTHSPVLTRIAMDGADARTANHSRLRQFIEAESPTLLRTLRLYAMRGRLTAPGSMADTIASELLSELTIEALSHAERFDPSRQPMAWLLGIAANLVRRRQVEMAKHNRREPLARDLASAPTDTLSDEDLFDWLATLNAEHEDPDCEELDTMWAMIDSLRPDDRNVLELAFLNDLDGEALAKELGIRPGAARVRLHRALLRLRDKMQRRQ